VAWQILCHKRTEALEAAEAKSLGAVLNRKQSLLLRPIKLLMSSPHLLAAWLSINKQAFAYDGEHLSWAENPVELLADTYHFLRMDWSESAAAASVIWDHDYGILSQAEDFYADVTQRFGVNAWAEQTALLSGTAPKGIEASDWADIQAAHRGFQAGMEILELLPAMARFTGFYELKVNEDLTIDIPERLLDEEYQAKMTKCLAPPPVAKTDEVVAASGGMFYGRESPDSPLYVQAGDHFEAGDPLYIVEVMKMFNKVYAPFSGTVDEVMVEGDGVIISKGQLLFKVTPDEKIEVESAEVIATRRRDHTNDLMQMFL
jgi:biotin carboxyl carrier protein